MKKPLVLLSAVLFATLAIFSQWVAPTVPAPDPWRWPELPHPDARLVRQIAADWNAISDELYQVDPPPTKPAAFARLLDDYGPGAGAALVSFWLAPDGTPDVVSKRSLPDGFTMSTTLADPIRDPTTRPGATWLAAHSNSTLDRVLVQVLGDPKLPGVLRERAVIALCRPGNPAAYGPLVDRLLDPEEEAAFWGQILPRLTRVDEPPPDRFRELLSLPFYHLDERAAAVLAVLGRPVAPSLVAEGLRRLTWFDKAIAALFGDAAIALVRKDPAVVDAAWPLLERARQPAAEIRPEDGVRLADALDAWLAAHPEMLDTPFERGRGEYLASPRRARELAIDGYEAVVATPEADLDFAAAALAVTWIDAPARAHALEQIDRFARLVKRDMGGQRTPEAFVAAMERRLRSRHIYEKMGEIRPESGLPFVLTNVLKTGRGNCVGRSSLYLAVGERLGLPLSMVVVPDHAFVRWDDGTTRLNLETTDAGAPFDDDAAKEKWGKVPASLMKKEAVAVVLSNLSALYLLDDSGAPDPRGLRDAERAVTLCPRLVSGWLNRAAAFLKLDAPRLSEARASVERALAIDPGSANARWSAARVRHAAGEEEAALEWTEKALEADPQMAVARAGKVEFLLVLGRYDEAVTTADGYHLPALGLKARILGSRPDWREFLAKEAPDPREDPGPWLYAAELQLEGNAQHAASPESADALLGEVSYLAKERFHISKKRYEELRARVDATLGK